MSRALVLAALCALSLFVGCRYDRGSTDFDFEEGGGEELNRYIEFVRGVARIPRPEGAPDGWYTGIPDWDLYPFIGTSRGCKRWYRLVYADRQYISFRCEEVIHRSDRQGGWETITVGSIDRRTGKRVTLDDVDAFADRKALTQRLYDAEVARHGGDSTFVRKENLILHDNFCLMEDGWHFVYDMGCLGGLSEGCVELVIGK